MKSDTKKDAGTPKWETLVLLISFLLVWGWWLARQAASRNETDISPLWQVVMLGAVAALIVVFVRRMKRTLASLHENHPSRDRRAERN